jgi:hypothetical protein
VTDATANAAFDLQVFHRSALNTIWAADQETNKTKGRRSAERSIWSATRAEVGLKQKSEK